MLNENDYQKIERYINGQTNDKEKAWIESQFLNGEDNYTLRCLLEKDWDKMAGDSLKPEVDLDLVLDRVHHIIRKNEILKRQKPLQKIVNIYMKAAAILLFPLIIAGGIIYSYLGYHGQSKNDQIVNSTIYAPLGARVAFNLPDGTTGMLNSDSRLSYSLPFINNRYVELEGEAWFDVKHDEDHPLEISTTNSTVKVLGTSFNISAYATENYVDVILQEGKVEFQNNKGDEKVSMLPSERLVFQNGTISKSFTDPEKYSAWTEGKLVFRGDPMAEVARRIERWYNVKVELADQELEKYSFRATFKDDKLEDVLHFLCMTSPIICQIIPRELLDDGTYKKEEVIIYLKK